VGFLGFGRKRSEFGDAIETDAHADRARVRDAAAGEREQLLEDISDFLLDNQLDVTPDNLFLAHQAMSGSHAGLAEQVMQRQISREEITADWLNETAKALGIARDRKAELDRMMKRLEGVLEAFLLTSRNAGNAASEFGDAIEGHARQAEKLGTAVIDGATLVELTRAMIDRTREAEAEMSRAEEETKCLRDRLKRAQREAKIDHLTGLPNRRAFDALYEREYSEARSRGEELCVALCDIDHFKLINDVHGHGVGDRVIQMIARHFKSLTNNRCHVARHGGEEFVLLFRGLTLDEAAEKLDGARAAFARRRLVNRENEAALGEVTYSGGITSVFAHDKPADALKAADVALYAAKSAGRNCVKIG
jgi:diguanylate cyclase